MEHTGTIRIETERLILRKIEIQDVKDFYELLTDKDVVAQLEFPEYTSIDMATSYINGKLKNKYEREDYYDWGIIEKASGRLVGRICVY